MIKQEVLDLLHQVRPLGSRSVQNAPVSEEQLKAFEEEHSLVLPSELREWFKCSNGASVNPGGLYSLFSQGKEASLDWYLNSYPDWKSNGWFPVASDGCGDLYMMTAQSIVPSSATHPVCFFDQSDFTKPQYAVASGLWAFLYQLLQTEVLRDQGKTAYWPFNKTAVLAVDPPLAECREIALPWEVETA